MQIDVIKQIKNICANYSDITKAVLFGSRARGDNTDRSDFDIAIYVNSNKYHNVLNDIDEINTLLKIDVTIITPTTKLDDLFLDNIKNEGVVIYMGKFQNRYMNFTKAVSRLQEVIEKFKLNSNDDILDSIFRDSLVQRFEFCYELSWKTLKDYMVYVGISVDNAPRSILKTAYQNEIIDNEEIWLNMISDRNVASHEYNENHIEEVANRIENDYLKEFVSLRDKLENVDI